MLTDIVNGKLLHLDGVVGFYRAWSVGDDIELRDDLDNPLGVLHGLRQQVGLTSICVLFLESECLAMYTYKFQNGKILYLFDLFI